MQRIPIRIYRLKITSTNQEGVVARQAAVADSAYAQGITTDNIQVTAAGTRVVSVKIGSDSQSAPQVATVYVDEQGRNYYKNGNTKVYIREAGGKPTYDDLPPVFEFYVNPQSIQTSYNKLQTEVRTRGGWEIQHWGEQLATVTVTGKSGGMHRDTSVPAKPGEQGQALGKTKTVMDSTAWKRLTQLKQLYDADHARGSQSSELILLGMNYFDKFFIGYFVNFSGPNTSAENPYIVEYSFTFKVQQEVSSTNFETQQTGGQR